MTSSWDDILACQTSSLNHSTNKGLGTRHKNPRVREKVDDEELPAMRSKFTAEAAKHKIPAFNYWAMIDDRHDNETTVSCITRSKQWCRRFVPGGRTAAANSMPAISFRPNFNQFTLFLLCHLRQQSKQMDNVMIVVVQMQRCSLWSPTHIHKGCGDRCHRGCVVEEMLSHCLRVSTWRSGLANISAYQAYGQAL
jgi:hypothetical protein